MCWDCPVDDSSCSCVHLSGLHIPEEGEKEKRSVDKALTYFSK